MQLTRSFKQSDGQLVSRTGIAIAGCAVACMTLAAGVLTAALGAEPKGFLEGLRRHSMVTSTVPANGDQNPYAIVHRTGLGREDPGRRRAGRQLQRPQQPAGSRQHHRHLPADDKEAHPVRRHPPQSAAVPRRRRAHHRDGHAEIRLGDRRQPAKPGRHHEDQGPGLPDRARRAGQCRRHHRGTEHQRAHGATWR